MGYFLFGYMYGQIASGPHREIHRTAQQVAQLNHDIKIIALILGCLFAFVICLIAWGLFADFWPLFKSEQADGPKEQTQAQKEWARCQPWIAAALQEALGTHTLGDIEEAIASGRMQFWPGKRSAIVTEIITYPRLRALNYFLLGGDLTELKEMEPSITAWAKAIGCTRVIGIGRKGFERVFKSFGYRPAWYAIMKEI